MSRRKVAPVNQIVCDGGKTYVECATVSAVYRYKYWILRFNPALLLPPLRKEHRKLFIVNGKRKGWGEIRYGWIPLSRFELPGSGLSVAIKRILRKCFGLGLMRYESGYIYVGVGPYRFVVVQRTSKDGIHLCEIYDKRTEELVGNLAFNSEFTGVYVYPTQDGVTSTLYVIAGYVADTLVYSRAAGMLQKTIKLIL